MRTAYRGHYEPATQQILPDADPYIAALVLEATGAAALPSARRAQVYQGHVYHGPAYHGSTDPRARFVGEASPPLVSDPATRDDRRRSLGRSTSLSHRSRRLLLGARG